MMKQAMKRMGIKQEEIDAQQVIIRCEDKEIVIDVYVVVEYGMRISAVANSVKNTVSFHVKQALGIPVSAVNVYVQELRFSKSD